MDVSFQGLGDLYTNIVHPGNDNELLQQQLDEADKQAQLQLSASQYAIDSQAHTVQIIVLVAAILLFIFLTFEAYSKSYLNWDVAITSQFFLL